ncbi:hypothetical protein ACH5RR_006369 [Cinchona calisaya]|uniref:mitogen-activated protein kinase kinase n=1 Tax=Cinchona calisaya TaxID=153742 RepID=A0ABD3AP51_9GENT
MGSSIDDNLPPFTIDNESGRCILILPTETPTFYGDDYERVTHLGHGCYGTVYRVCKKHSCEEFAVKEKLITSYEDILKRVYREVELVGKLNHPNILNILAVECLPGKVRFLTELMGIDLSHFHCRDEKVIASVAKQLLATLFYLKQRGIVHRDLKPSNMLLSPDGCVIKICDFETSVDVSTQVLPLASSDLFNYSAPELLDTRLSCTGIYTSDVLSMGLCLLEFYLDGFSITVESEDIWSLVSQIVYKGEPPRAPPESSKEFQDFISQCLHREPKNRACIEKLMDHDFIKMNTMQLDVLDKESSLLSVSDRINFEEDWIVDSGCSNHMTGDKEKLKDMTEYKKRRVVVTTINTKLPITHVGKTTLSPRFNNEEVQLLNVYHVLGLKKNLPSVLQMARSSNFVVFGPDDVKVY